MNQKKHCIPRICKRVWADCFARWGSCDPQGRQPAQGDRLRAELGTGVLAGAPLQRVHLRGPRAQPPAPRGRIPAPSLGRLPFTGGEGGLPGRAEPLCLSPLQASGCSFSSTSCRDSCCLFFFFFFLGDATVASSSTTSKGEQLLGSQSQQ